MARILYVRFKHEAFPARIHPRRADER